MKSFISSCLLGLAVAACGNGSVSESLPNQMVPLNEVAGSATSPRTAPTPAHASPSTPESHADTPSSPNALARLPDPAQSFTLSSVAFTLGSLDSKTYLEHQIKWVGNPEPACNFFLITALCESGYCQKQKPFYKAADFKIYFIAQGWTSVALNDLKERFLAQKPFDAVFQKAGVPATAPGHVMIPIGYDADTNLFTVAQGNLGETTNEIEEVGEDFLLHWNGGFTNFVKE